jgi:subtilase family serine protease
VVTQVSGPSTAPAYSLILVTATVCNQGTSTSYGGALDAYVSTDATITQTDELAGSLPSPYWLESGACATVSATVVAAGVPGTYRLGAFADSQGSVAELLEDNNGAAAPGSITLY